MDLTGISDGFRTISYDGKTDPQIVREALLHHSLPFDSSMVAALFDRYLEYLPPEMAVSPAQLKPGVPHILDLAQSKDALFLGVLTGNVESGARIKLARFDLNRYFEVGAFGSDHEDRNVLLPVAVERLCNARGVSVQYEHCVVVGDTPLDVQCAHAYGARCVAAATGRYSLRELERAAADLVVEDLSDADRIVEWIATLPD